MANKMPCVIQKVTQTAFFHGRYDNQNYEHTQSQHNLTSSCVPSRCGFFHHLPGEGVWGCLDFNKGCYWCLSCSSSPSLLPVSSLPVGMLWATPGLDGHIASSGGGGVCLDRTTISRAQGVVEWAWTRQIECQLECQIECQNRWQIECQSHKYFQMVCQKPCQKSV